mmetsp:Transcript_101119/g.171044  ORF Transcript_101119/g.171044 Transcript_101119/m.171044 type:complete len:227 (-) Transcript_101119:5186-5866(-)
MLNTPSTPSCTLAVMVAFCICLEPLEITIRCPVLTRSPMPVNSRCSDPSLKLALRAARASSRASWYSPDNWNCTNGYPVVSWMVTLSAVTPDIRAMMSANCVALRLVPFARVRPIISCGVTSHPPRHSRTSRRRICAFGALHTTDTPSCPSALTTPTLAESVRGQSEYWYTTSPLWGHRMACICPCAVLPTAGSASALRVTLTQLNTLQPCAVSCTWGQLQGNWRK